jgi:hypothetical protein
MAGKQTNYSLAEAAEELGITERRVRQLVTEGRLITDEDGMGRQRLTKAQLDVEMGRRGRETVRSLPRATSGPTGMDPLVARVEETNDLLRELILALRAMEIIPAIDHLSAMQRDMAKVLTAAVSRNSKAISSLGG